MEMETETIETKKCNNCLRRVNVGQNRCSFCRKDDFTYDGAVIVRVIKRKFNLVKSIAAMLKKN
jgi:RNA polymerase subunit RPABC4/transcription elongation factor Spt4